MCGIAGIITFSGAPPSRLVLDAMNAKQLHRGPDGVGTHVQGPVGIGHRRLAVLDPERGAQPIGSDDGQVWMTYNGEIYNHLDLRSDLQGSGHRFATLCDTETLLHAYLEWGDDCVNRLRGMFAFAIVDYRRSLVLLARDHFGIKPLVYSVGGTGAAFASEIQALRCVPGIGTHINLEGIDRFLRLQYIPSPDSAFKDVKKLPPAHRLWISFSGKVRGPEPYWKLEFRPENSPSPDEWSAKIEKAVTDSVRAHLIADVPTGAFLSGGLDSTLVAGIMAHVSNRPIETFSMGFEDAEFNELPFARQAAHQMGSIHHEDMVGTDSLAVLSDMIRLHGEPFGDSSWLATQQVSRLARSRVTVALSGDGGDEAFAGYNTYRSWMEWLGFHGMPPWKKALRRMLGYLGRPRWPRRLPTLSNWMNFIQQISSEQLHTLWRPELRSRLSGRMETFERVAREAGGASPSHLVQTLDFNTYLPDDILMKVDHASMMHSLEVRTPLIDLEVIRIATSIPAHMTLAIDQTGQWQGKLPIKRLLESSFPSSFVHRRKMGFTVPTHRWLAPGGSQRRQVEDRLRHDGPLWTLLDRQAVHRLLDLEASNSLWLLVALDEWLKQNSSLSIA